MHLETRWRGMRLVALLGVLGACSSSVGLSAGGKGGAGAAVGGTAGTAGAGGGTGGTAGTAGAVGMAGTGGTIGSAGTGGAAGAAGGCTNLSPSEHVFGCEPSYLAQVAVLCAMGSVPAPERSVALCGSLRIVSLSVPDYTRSCVYDDAGALFAARACVESTWCGQRCLDSVNWAIFECDAWPMVCATDAGAD